MTDTKKDDLIEQANKALQSAESDIKTVNDLAWEIKELCEAAGVEFMAGIAVIVNADEKSQDKYIHLSTNGGDTFKFEMVKLAVNQIKSKGILEQLLPYIQQRLEESDAPEQSD